MIGRTLGRYEIMEEVGRGGMATVYRARQIDLNRDVALKILAPEFSRDPGFVARFRREATIAARLDHPHIVPIYDVGEHDGLLLIAMRYVPGETLAARLARYRVLPPDQASGILEQIAGALDYAHARGVVHRDLKPANILLEPDGRASLTDFGIAWVPEATPLTQAGTLTGTPEYMAPEQAQGREIDGRADQYALAVIAFRMLAGRVPFTGESGLAVLHRHVTEPPPAIGDLQPRLPAGIDAVLRRALAKDPARRYPNVSTFVGALAAATRPATNSAPAAVAGASAVTARVPVAATPAVAARNGARNWAWPAVALIVLLAGAAMVFAWWRGSEFLSGAPNGGAPVAAPPPSVTPEQATSPTDPTSVAVAVLPSATAERTATPEPTATATSTDTPVPATPTATARPPQPTATTRPPAATATRQPAAPTATPESLLERLNPFADRGPNPPPSPTAAPPAQKAPASPADAKAPPAPSGQILFASARNGWEVSQIYGVQADGAGEVQLTEQQTTNLYPSWSPDGSRFVYLQAPRAPEGSSPAGDLVVQNTDGSGRVQLTEGRQAKWPKWSPDGGWIVFAESSSGQSDLYRIRPDGSGLQQVTEHPGFDGFPAWTPDGGLVFASERGGGTQLWLLPAGSAEARRLTNRKGQHWYPAVSPDGRRVAFASDSAGSWDIYTMALDGSDPRQITSGPADDFYPAWSPDGAWLAFHANRAGGSNWDIYLVPAAGGDVRRLTTLPASEVEPAWR